MNQSPVQQGVKKERLGSGLKEKLYILTIVLSGSGIVLSRDIGFSIDDILVVLLVLILLFAKRNTVRIAPLTNKWIFALITVIAVTMIYRGMGLKVFGDERSGGGIYIKLLAYAVLFVLTSRIKIRTTQWKRILFWWSIFYWIPFIVELLFSMGIKGVWNHHILITLQDNTLQSEQSENILRLATGGVLSVFIVFMSFIAWPVRKKLSFIHYIFILLSIFIAGLSGHRIAIFQIVSFIFLRLTLDKNTSNKRAFAFASCFALLIFIAATFYYSHLPEGLQRALSFVPSTPTTSTPAIHAITSTNWRIELWEILLGWIPQYFWIGKGVTLYSWELNQALSALSVNSSITWGLMTGNFHNGPLSLLISFGIFGLLFSIAFFWAVIRYATNFLRTWVFRSLDLYNSTLNLVSLFLLYVITFFFLYGDLSGMFPQILLTGSMVISMIYSFKKEDLIERARVDRAI